MIEEELYFVDSLAEVLEARTAYISAKHAYYAEPSDFMQARITEAEEELKAAVRWFRSDLRDFLEGMD